MRPEVTLFGVLLVLPFISFSQISGESVYKLNNTAGLNAYGIKLTSYKFKGMEAVRVEPADNNTDAHISMIAELAGSNFKNGIIEVELASQPGENAPEGSRGFAGIAFRIHDDLEHYECIYLRPTNGRANDQIRRNHATQYVSQPGYPWYRLRKENPGVYESYVDLQPGVWTKFRIEIDRNTAKLFVHDTSQPVLIINDLKYGPDQQGSIGLWIGGGTDAYFSNLKITNK